MYFDEERNIYTKQMVIVTVLIIVLFSCLDIMDVWGAVADGLKLAGVVLCFCYVLLVTGRMGADLDRIALCCSFLFAIAADTFLLFTGYYFWGIVFFCIVQEFHSLRILAIRKAVVRLDGRVSSSYRGYKLWSRLLVRNFIQLACAAVPLVISLFVELANIELICIGVFYVVGFIGNLLPLEYISRDMRLLDDIRPLKLYFYGMVMYFLCDVLLGVFRMPDFFGILMHLQKYSHAAVLLVWPLYLAGLLCIALSAVRNQDFYS